MFIQSDLIEMAGAVLLLAEIENPVEAIKVSILDLVFVVHMDLQTTCSDTAPVQGSTVQRLVTTDM
jgi:hypothetical protein